MPTQRRKCLLCTANVARGSICEACAQCRCGSGRPPNLCHGRAMTRRELIVRWREAGMTSPQIRERLLITKQRLHQIENGYEND